MTRAKKGRLDFDRLLARLTVECVENWGVERRLTVGKIYTVIGQTGGAYRIKTDTNRTQLFSPGFFKVITK